MDKFTEQFNKIITDPEFVTIRDKFFKDIDKITKDFKKKLNNEEKKN